MLLLNCPLQYSECSQLYVLETSETITSVFTVGRLNVASFRNVKNRAKFKKFRNATLFLDFVCSEKPPFLLLRFLLSKQSTRGRKWRQSRPFCPPKSLIRKRRRGGRKKSPSLSDNVGRVLARSSVFFAFSPSSGIIRRDEMGFCP